MFGMMRPMESASAVNETGPPFRRVLIANRGEIAVRVIRACRELGVETVAVYGDGEERAIHVRLADDAYRITGDHGLPYLDVEALVAIGTRAGASAIHPGYGFLAENAAFAEACVAAGMTFVGPPAAAIRSMGDKVEARRIATGSGVPVVPGSDGAIESIEAAHAWAEHHGFPVAVKAAGGGGGRGFRVARDAAALDDAFTGAAGEAERSFANPVVYVERYLDRPRHVEAQIFADTQGTVLFLGERDCSIQRRHQKLIEETPSPAVTPHLRQALGAAAAALARAVDYRGAGTVEFLVAGDGSFFFLEMNTRIQVEHTITEEVTGLDLVKEQLRVAAGCPLSWSSDDVAPRGHALECRVNAEDAGRDFAPGPGQITGYREPGGFGVRVDSAMETGAAVLPAYDSLIAKVVTRGRDRAEAVARMRRALADFEVGGVPTTIPFHLAVLDHPIFLAGEATTSFIEEHPETLPAPSDAVSMPALAGASGDVVVEVNGRRFSVRLHDDVAVAPTTHRAPRPPASSGPGGHRHGAVNGNEVISPIQGTVLRVLVKPGQTVEPGAVICVIEAMKMENELIAHQAGTIESIGVGAGDSVQIGDRVAVLTPPGRGDPA